MLNIQPQSFTVGFPGVTNRFEWFAIDYRGRIMLPQAGTYLFRLTSDDGSRLHIDGREVIDNDGVHGPDWKEAEVTLAAGIHDVRVQYFQGPREDVALVLEWGPAPRTCGRWTLARWRRPCTARGRPAAGGDVRRRAVRHQQRGAARRPCPCWRRSSGR